MKLHELSHPRRPIPDGSPFTKKVAEQRRIELAAFVLKAIPAEELLKLMQFARPPSIAELISLAHERAAEIPCQHCGKPPTKGD
jgi:hypothetical protein